MKWSPTLRFPKRHALRHAVALGATAALALTSFPAAAQPGVQATGASTPENCEIQLSVANPSPGDQEVPRSLAISGTATDETATSGTGISQIQAFLGSRDAGGMFIGGTTAISFAPGGWSLITSIPPNISGGESLFIYGTSSVSGQQAFVEIPIVVGEALTDITVSNQTSSFCPAFMTPPTPVSTQVALPTLQPLPTANPTVEPTAVPVVPTPVPPTPTAAPVSPPVPAPPPAPAAVQLAISSPLSPPLTFDTDMLFAAAGSQVTVTYTNNSPIEHNWHVFNGPDSSSGTLAATQIITGPGASDSVTFTAPLQPGNYFFWCDVHPTIMTGTFVVN